jgi:hypothetical protein
MVWFYQLFVVHYGKFAQFVDNTCMSSSSMLSILAQPMGIDAHE